MTTHETNFNDTTTLASEDLATYLVRVADKLQSRVDDVSNNMNKKLEEMTKRIDTLERSLKQTEPSTAPIAVTSTTNTTEDDNLK